MRKFDTPYLADWIATTLRWVLVFCLALSQALSGNLNLAPLLALFLPLIWNIFSSWMALTSRRMPGHRWINISFDTASAILLFVISGGLSGPLGWTGALAYGSGAIYAEFPGGVLVALLITAVQAAYTYFFTPEAFSTLSMALLAGGNLAGGLVLGVIGRAAVLHTRAQFQQQAEDRQVRDQRLRRSERDRMQTLFSMIEALSSTLNYRTVLESSLELSVSAIEDRSGAAQQIIDAILLFEERDLQIMTARGMPRTDLSVTFPVERGALFEVLRTGEAQLCKDPAADPELGRLSAMQDCRSALCLPLMRSMNAYGIMLFAHPDENFFTPDRVEVLVMISHQAVIAIQNARLYQELSQEKERLIQSQEEANRKLARSLHDGPTQSVAAIAMRLSIARRMLETSPAEAAAELQKVEDLARRTTQEIRTMLFTLRPLVLENEGLHAALLTMADKMRETFQQNVVVEVDDDMVSILDSNRQTVIFSLAEEAISNARKHAQAAEIRVRLRPAPNNSDIALLEIIDNGRGFNVDQVLGSYDRRGSLGMVNLRERADLINGRLKIESVVGRGTRIRVFVPLTPEAADRLDRGI